jgi:hypothetical protein
MALALQRRGKLRNLLGKDDAALADLERAEPLLQGILAHEPSNRVWQGNLSSVRLERMRILLGRKDTASVLPALLALDHDAEVLTALDSKKRDWARLSSLTKQTIGNSLTQLRRREDARIWLDKSVSQLKALYDVNPADKPVAFYLARALIDQAESLVRDREMGLRACKEAADLVSTSIKLHDDYRMLDPWARSQLCLGNRTEAEAAMERLARIGYQEASYLNYIRNHNLKENQG